MNAIVIDNMEEEDRWAWNSILGHGAAGPIEWLSAVVQISPSARGFVHESSRTMKTKPLKDGSTRECWQKGSELERRLQSGRI